MLKTLFLSSVAVATLSLFPVHAMNPNKDFVPLFPTASTSSTSTSSTSSTSSRVTVAPVQTPDIMDEITKPEPVSGPMGPIMIRDANGVVRFVAPRDEDIQNEIARVERTRNTMEEYAAQYGQTLQGLMGQSNQGTEEQIQNSIRAVNTQTNKARREYHARIQALHSQLDRQRIQRIDATIERNARRVHRHGRREAIGELMVRSLLSQPLIEGLMTLAMPAAQDGTYFTTTDMDALLNVVPHLRTVTVTKAAWNFELKKRKEKLEEKTSRDLTEDGLTRYEFDHFMDVNRAAHHALLNKEETRLRTRLANSLQIARAAAPSASQVELVKSLEDVDGNDVSQAALYNVWKTYARKMPGIHRYSDESYEAYKFFTARLKEEANANPTRITFYPDDLEDEEAKRHRNSLTVLPPKDFWDRLTNLDTLDFDGSNVIDFSFLRDLTTLEWISLRQAHHFSDLSLLSRMTNLRELNFSLTPASNLEFISHLTGLHDLWMEGCRTTTLEPLRRLTNIDTLDMESLRNVTDISPLTNLIPLSSVLITGNDQLFNLLPGEDPQAAEQRIQTNRDVLRAIGLRDFVWIPDEELDSDHESASDEDQVDDDGDLEE